MRIFAKRSDPGYVEGKYYYRISARRDDPGYVKDVQNYGVFLNGVKLKDCFTADEEQGIAYIYERDTKTGNFLSTLSDGEYKLMERFVRGHVFIKKVK